MKKILMSAVACALLSGSAYAGGKGVVETEVVVIDIPEVEKVYDDSFYTLGLKVGTLGVGVDASMALNHNFSVRANVNGLNYTRTLNDIIDSTSISEDFNTYGGNADATIDFLTAGILIDYFPFDESDFRLTAGVYYNNNSFKLKGNSTADINVGTKVYNAAQAGSVTGDITFENKVSPYIGWGWGNRNDEPGWSWSLDFGVLYQGLPKVAGDIALTGATIDELNAAGAVINTVTSGQINDELDAEIIKTNNDIENADYANYLKFWPVVTIGITYSF